MSTDTKLAVLQRDITIPGCRFSPTSLVFDTIDDETLSRAGHYLLTIDVCRAWWWGDYINAYCARKLERRRLEQGRQAAAVETEEDREAEFVHYTAEYADATTADATKVDEATLHTWRAVAAFYQFPSRLGNLSWSHHHEAMANHTPAEAHKWLKQAQQHGWSKTDLRAAIRKAAQKEEDEASGPKPTYTMHEPVACCRWARATLKRVDDMHPSEAQTIKGFLAPIVELDKRLTLVLEPDLQS